MNMLIYVLLSWRCDHRHEPQQHLISNMAVSLCAQPARCHLLLQVNKIITYHIFCCLHPLWYFQIHISNGNNCYIMYVILLYEYKVLMLEVVLIVKVINVIEYQKQYTIYNGVEVKTFMFPGPVRRLRLVNTAGQPPSDWDAAPQWPIKTISRCQGIFHEDQGQLMNLQNLSV